MKKISLYPFILSALLCLAGCADEDPFGSSSAKGENSLVAVIEGQETDVVSRTAVDETGRVTWIATDALGVYAAHTKNALFSSTGSGASVVFKGNLSPNDNAAEWAYYPYDAHAVVNGQALSFTLPDEYTYTGNSHAPMLAMKGSEGRFEFKHLCGLLRITLGGGMPSDADRFVISSVGDDAPALSGVATVDDVTAADATLALSEEDGRTVTYTLGSLSSAENFQHFFVPLPVGSYPKLQVAFYKKDKSEPEFTRTLSNLQVRRAVMTCMPILDWRTGEQFVLSKGTKVITESLSKKISVSNTDNSILFYQNISEEETPKVGDVIWSRLQEGFPYGFLGKVTSVTSEGDNNYQIITQPASLSEAFDELYIDEESELTTDALSRSTIETGGLNIAKELPFNVQDKEERYGLNGKLDVGGTVQMTVAINKEKKLEQLTVTFVPKFDVNAKIVLTGEFNKEGEKGDFPLSDINCGVIPLGAGLIPLVPAVQVHGYLVPQGKITTESLVDYEARVSAGVEFKDGVFSAGANPIKQDTKGLSLDLISSKIVLNGRLFYGFGVELKGKFYNSDKMKIYALAKSGIQMEAEVEVSSKDTESLEDKLKDLSIFSKKLVTAGIGIDATLVHEDAEKTFDLPAIYWDEKEHKFFPMFTQLTSKVTEKIKPLTVTTRATEDDGYEALVETRAAGDLLSKDVQLNIELMDEKGEVIDRSEPIYYTESYSESIPLSAIFSNLKSNASYTAYVVIQSRMFGDVAVDKKVKLESVSTTFAVGESLRDQLVQIYKDTNGDNWTNNENWCTDEPIENWYGVHNNGQGKYVINLPENNLTGTFSLSSPDIMGLELRNNLLTAINVGDCTNLERFGYSGNPLTLLDISKCNSLQNFHLFDLPQLKTFKARQNSKVTSLSFYNSSLEVLDVNGCENLTDCQFPNEKTLRSVNLGGCKALQNDPLSFIWEHPIEILDVSGLSYPSMISISLPETIEELYVNDCNSLQLITNAVSTGGGGNIPSNLRILEARNSTGMEQIYCVNNQLTLLDVRNSSVKSIFCNNDDDHIKQGAMVLHITGCPNLEYLNCSSNQLTELNLAGCIGLTSLNCFHNELSSLDFSDNHNLVSLYVNGNHLSDIDVTPCYDLEELSCDGNPMSSLDVSGNRSLKSLSCGGTGLNPNLNFTSLTLNNPELEDFYCTYSGLTSLDLSKYKYLKRVQCAYNPLKSLNLSGCTSLESVSCNDNELIELNVNQCYALKVLDCSNNQLKSLDLNDCNSFVDLRCGNNQLTELEVSAFSELEILSCGVNKIASLNIKGLSKLSFLEYRDNNIESLDATGCINLETLDGDVNPTKKLILNDCQSLKRIDFRETPLEVLDLTGCVGLTDIFLRGVQLTSLDVSSCSSLQVLDCAENISLATLLLPEDGLPNFSRMAVQDTRITREIPNWLTFKSGQYEQRYTDYKITYVQGEKQVTYTDKGYGWWYPGEPDKGYHRAN